MNTKTARALLFIGIAASVLAATSIYISTRKEPPPQRLGVTYDFSGESVDVGRYHNLALAPWNLGDVDGAKTLAQATRLAVDDAVIAPLWLFKDTTATKSHLTFTPRADRLILATNVKPKGS